MFTLAICLSFLSIFCLYSQSQKVEIEPKGLMLLLKTRKMLARALSGSALLLSTLIYIGQMGFAAGIFTGMIIWMLMASLMVLFIPFGKVTWTHLSIGLLMISGIEIGAHYL